MMNPQALEQHREQVKKVCLNPKLVITYLWITTLFFGAIFSIAAIVFAVNNNGTCASDSKSLGFAGIWMMFLVIALSIGGTMVMRQYHTPLAVGFFLGVCVMMCFNMFSMSVLFCGAAYQARRDNLCDGDIHTDEAAAVFAFFMFLLYGIFSLVLAKHRQSIIQSGPSTNVNLEQDKTTTVPGAPVTVVTTTSTAPPPVSV